MQEGTTYLVLYILNQPHSPSHVTRNVLVPAHNGLRGGNAAGILICTGQASNAMISSAFISYFYAYRMDLLNTKFFSIFTYKNVN